MSSAHSVFQGDDFWTEAIRALDALSAASDINELLHILAEELLMLEDAVAVEIALAAPGDHQLTSEYGLRANGAHQPLFPDIGSAQLPQTAFDDASPHLGFLNGFDGNGSGLHILVHPITRGSAPVGRDPAPLGVVVLGYPDQPSLEPERIHRRHLLGTRFAYRFQQLLAERLSVQQKARLDLVDEISAMVVEDGSNELRFNTAVRRIEEVFNLDAVALYAGKPLTLRLLCGGRKVRLGTPVPAELAGRVAGEVAPIVIGDIAPDARDALPPWVSPHVRSEVLIPLIYRNRRIGVLDLYSSYAGAIDATDLQILEALARQLALLVVQERWEESDEGTTRRLGDGQPAIRNRTVLDRDNEGVGDSQQLQAAYDRLQEFAELKDQILQNISHELRTPLTLIKGYLELMMEGQMGELSPEQRQSLEMIVRKADDVTRIVEEIVSLSPLNRLSLSYQRIPLSELVTELALVFVQRTQGSGIVWDFEPVDEDLYLSGDLAQIRQVFYNILDNSVKFSPEGGRIRVRAIAEPAHVHLIFEDEGIGIPKPRLTQIFETFYQVDGSSTRRFGGLGLGLAVVARVVKAHNGKVWAESELGKGSTFHVLLPKYLSPNQVFHPAMSRSG